MSEAAHSRIGASSMERWSACPGSVRLSLDLPSTASPYALEGTRAHEIAAAMLTGKPWQCDDAEMVSHCEGYADYVRSRIAGRNSTILVEQRFALPAIHKDLFGTADAIIFLHKEKRLIVVDFKYGAGVPVDVRGNKQLLYYLLGAYTYLDRNEIDAFECVIYQPRIPDRDPVQSWELDVLELWEFESYLKTAAEATDDPDAPLVTGAHCRWCPAAGICPQARQESLAVAKKVFEPVTSYNAEDLGRTLHKIDAIESWCAAVRQFAYGEASRGRVIPGWKLVDKRPQRRWRDGDRTPARLRTIAETHGLDASELFDAPKLKSPAQVEKFFKKFQINKALMGELVTSESSGTKLVPDSDPQPEVNVAPASVFEPVVDIFN